MGPSGRDGPTAMSAEADEMSFLRYRTGERIKVGDFVRELVDGHERNGIVDRVYDPDSIAAEVFGLLRGVCSVTWSDRKFPALMTPDDIRQQDSLLFVHRGDPRMHHMRYRTGERIELGDVVMEPVNAHERFGVIDAVWEPGSSGDASMGLPQGCFNITWCGGTGGDARGLPETVHATSKFVDQQDVLIFVRRGYARAHPTGGGPDASGVRR